MEIHGRFQDVVVLIDIICLMSFPLVRVQEPCFTPNYAHVDSTVISNDWKSSSHLNSSRRWKTQAMEREIEGIESLETMNSFVRPLRINNNTNISQSLATTNHDSREFFNHTSAMFHSHLVGSRTISASPASPPTQDYSMESGDISRGPSECCQPIMGWWWSMTNMMVMRMINQWLING